VLLAGSGNAAQIKRSHKNQFSIQLPVIALARVVLIFPPSLYKVGNYHAQNANNDEPKRNRFYPQGVIPQENSNHHCANYRED
jgi:hypothetical protein